jgi:DNA helicase-2/ATP-dependent DNA helicase PcrA
VQQLPDNINLDEIIEAGTKSLAQYQTLEDFLWPTDQPPELKALQQYPALGNDFLAFGAQMRHWLQATILPIDQLILTIAQDLFRDPTDLALSHKMALSLRSAHELHPEWRLAEFIQELQTISENERRFVGMEDMVTGYEPKPGMITVATMHAAKGLEWDRVYLLAVNNYSFPSVQPGDNFISEKWFVRDQLNLEAEILAQVDAIKADSTYIEGDASRQARIDYAAERLRLLYVGITRARRELVILWNTGRFGYKGDHLTCQPALPLTILIEYLAGTRMIKRQLT